MKRILVSILAAGLAVAACERQASLEQHFREPPVSAKPHTWWHWMNGNVTKAGIKADLEAMAAYLPTLIGKYVGTEETTERFLWDFRRTCADLFADNYLSYMGELCHEHGLLLYNEPYNTTVFDELQVGGRADIKKHPDWNHIPVILLTAKADAASSVEGMKAGADAYVPKPFDPDFLKATVESILRNRRILQEKVRNLTSADLQDPEKAEELPLTSAEKAFLEKIHAYLDANLDNVDADVAGMADELCMSYSSLYAKVKALTGETPKAYSTAYRMNIARQLLLSGEWTVSEVADKVGVSSPSTFSREFKKHFGEAPSQIKR